jgi:hypothetical protein
VTAAIQPASQQIEAANLKATSECLYELAVSCCEAFGRGVHRRRDRQAHGVLVLGGRQLAQARHREFATDFGMERQLQ